MHAQIIFDHAQHSDRKPSHLTIQDRNYNHIVVFVDTVALADRLLVAVAAQRDALAEAEAAPAPVDGCSCGSPDLPGFDHLHGCPRRSSQAAA